MKKISLIDRIEKKVGGQDKLIALLIILFVGLIVVAIIWSTVYGIANIPEVVK